MRKFWNACRAPLAGFGLFCLICIPVVILFDISTTPEAPHAPSIAYSDFLNLVGRGDVKRVNMSGSNIDGVLADNGRFHTEIPQNVELAASLAAKSIVVVGLPDDGPGANSFLRMVIAWTPITLYFLAMWLWLARPLNRMVAIIESKSHPSQ